MPKAPRGQTTESADNTLRPAPKSLFYDFGPFTLRTRDSVLLRDGAVVPMRHKVLETLRVLVEEHGHFISRGELLDRVWSGEFVEESSITQNISLLRRVLDPEFPGQRPIETLSKKGYRFAVPVTIREGDTPTATVFKANVAPPPASDAQTGQKNMVGQILVFAPSRIADAIIARDTDQQVSGTAAGGSEEIAAEPLSTLPEPDAASSSNSSAEPIVAIAPEESTESGLDAPAVGPQGPIETRSPLPGRRWMPWALVASVFIVVISAWLVRRHFRNEAAAKHTIAILGMQNLKNDPQQEWVGAAVVEMLSTGLVIDSPVSVVSGAPVARMRHDLNLPTTVSLAPEAAVSVCKYLACTDVIVGSYLVEGHRIWLDLKLEDAGTGKVLTAIAVSGGENELHQLVSESVAKLRSVLDLEATSAGINQPSMPENGLREYAMGLENLEADNIPAAYALLLQATHDAPDSPLAHEALARTWKLMGYEQESAKEAAQAVALSKQLPGLQRDEILAFQKETSRDWPAAIKLYTRLHNEHPLDQKAVLDLARVQRESGQAAAAVSFLSSSPVLANPEIQLELATAQIEVADNSGALTSARAAEQLARERGATSTATAAQLLQAFAKGRQGQVPEAISALDELQQQLRKANDQRLLARALRYQATFLRQAGTLDKALAEFEEALRIAQATGDRPGMIDSLAGLGNVQRNQDHLDLARNSFQQGLELAREIGDKRREALMLVNVSNTTNNMGDPDTAVLQQEEGLRLAIEVGDRHTVMNLHGNMGVIFAHQGNLTRGAPLLETAVREARDLKEPHMEAYYEGHLVSVHHYQGDDEGALRTAEHSCSIFRDLHEVRYEAGCVIQLASLNVERGHYPEAHKLLAPLLLDSTKPSVSTQAWETEAECMLDEGRIAEARAASNNSLRLAAQTLNSEDYAIPAGILSAKIKIAEGDLSGAEVSLLQLASRAHSLHLLPKELDARLQLAEIHQRQGKPNAVTELDSIKKDALSSNLFLFKSRAESYAVTRLAKSTTYKNDITKKS